MSDNFKSIHLTYLNGKGFIFNASDYIRVRKEYKLIGKLVGTCNIFGWTPNTNGLPAEYNQYETQLLIENDFAILLDKSISLTKQTQEKEIPQGETSLQQSNNKNTKKIFIQIPYEHQFEHKAKIKTLPILDSIKYKVFKDIWNKGKYITSGESFGSDFIIYPGDPLMFHASHIINVIEDQEPLINALDIISKSRLATTVKKICVFAYFNHKLNCISYQCIKWQSTKKQH